MKNIFKQSKVSSEKKFMQSEPQRKYCQVRFTQNRTFEIYVDGQLIRFPAYGLPSYPSDYAKNGIPESVIKSDDFESVRRYFSIS